METRTLSLEHPEGLTVSQLKGFLDQVNVLAPNAKPKIRISFAGLLKKIEVTRVIESPEDP